MGKKIPAAAVPSLRLTPQDEADLRHLGVQLEREVVSMFENYLFRDQRSVDAAKWKAVRSEGGLHAYKEYQLSQKGAPRGDALTALYDAEKQSPGPQQLLAERSTQPRVLVTGTVPGTLDDLMYGMGFQDTPSFQDFWASRDERVDESAVVAKLEGAGVDDPYRFLGILWVLRSFPLNIFQRRDHLSLSVRRTTQLSNGDRVGISIGHSIEHRDLPELLELNTIRAVSSLLTIYRQYDADRVEVFVVHFAEANGSIPDSTHVREGINYVMSTTASMCEAGFRRKLEWLVKRRQHDHLDDALGDAIEPKSSGTNDFCEVCDKKLGKLFSSPGTSCQLCYQRICSRCRVSHELLTESSRSTRAALRAHDFCMQCSLHARTTPTLSVAQDLAQYRHSTTSTSSVKSSSLSSTKSSDSSSSMSRDRTLTTLLPSGMLKTV